MTLKNLVKKFINKKNGYKILEKPDLDELKKDFYNVWQNDFIAKKQTAKVEEQIENYNSIAPMKVAVDLIKKIDLKNPSLLEIGCSSGYYSEIFKKAGIDVVYHGCDYSEEFIKIAKQKYPDIDFKVSDAINLKNYNDNQFDIVISGCCILHIIDYPKAISESARVSNKYVLFHRTPILHENKTLFAEKIGYGSNMIEIFFNEEELINLFNKNGLVVQNINTHAKFPVNGLGEHVFMKSYLCKKM